MGGQAVARGWADEDVVGAGGGEERAGVEGGGGGGVEEGVGAGAGAEVGRPRPRRLRRMVARVMLPILTWRSCTHEVRKLEPM